MIPIVQQEGIPDILRVEFNGKKYHFYKSPQAVQIISEIFSDNYKLFDKGIEFRDGDIIIDAGANEGMFSILMAKQFPKVKIFALEPVHRTFFQMIRNIGLNGVMNVFPENIGLGAKESRCGVMNVHNELSGGSSLVDTFNPACHEQVKVQLTSLGNFFKHHNFGENQRVRLLKIDIEGGEYDAFAGCEVLQFVDYVVGEFHINKRLEEKGCGIDQLAAWVAARTNLSYYERCRMAE